jgi:DNA-binding NarL/FixJ family response regulator
MTADRVRVLLVDDHAMMRAGFRMILEADGAFEVVGEAATGTEAVARTRALQPDVVCMDVQMPDMDGLEATRRIVADPETSAAVLVVTTFDRDDYLFSALEAGASGFLLKNAGPEELVAAVRVVAAGDALLAPEVTRRVIARFAVSEAASGPGATPGSDARAGCGSGAPAGTRLAGGNGDPARSGGPGGSMLPAGPGLPGGSPDAAGRGFVGGSPDAARFGFPPGPFTARAATDAHGLTDREAEVLRLMAEALSNAEIAQRLYIGEATVKTHVSNVLQKLGARDRVQAVVLAHRNGLT